MMTGQTVRVFGVFWPTPKQSIDQSQSRQVASLDEWSNCLRCVRPTPFAACGHAGCPCRLRRRLRRAPRSPIPDAAVIFSSGPVPALVPFTAVVRRRSLLAPSPPALPDADVPFSTGPVPVPFAAVVSSRCRASAAAAAAVGRAVPLLKLPCGVTRVAMRFVGTRPEPAVGRPEIFDTGQYLAVIDV